MRIVELLNEGPGADADPPTSDLHGDQRAFGQLLVTGAASRFLRLPGGSKDASKAADEGPSGPLDVRKAAAGEAADNPLYLLLRATQAAEKDQKRPQDEDEDEDKDKQQVDAVERGRRQRRAKQRVVFRRCYYKKINTLTALRTEHGELQAALAALLARHRLDSSTTGRNRFVALAEEKEALRKQRGRLATAATAQAKTRDTLQWLVDAEVKALAASERLEPLPAGVLDVPPMTKAEAAAIAAGMQVWKAQNGLEEDPERLDGLDGVFGWRTRCLSIGDGVQSVGVGVQSIWTSSKRVETDDSPLELCRRSLEQMTTPKRRGDSGNELVNLLAPWTGVEVTIIQRIDADHALLHINKGEGGGLFLCSLDSTEDGESCTLSIQPVGWAATSVGQFQTTNNVQRTWISVDQRRRGDRVKETSGCLVSTHFAVPLAPTTAPTTRSLAIEATNASCQWELQVVGGPLDFSSSSCSTPSTD